MRQRIRHKGWELFLGMVLAVLAQSVSLAQSDPSRGQQDLPEEIGGDGIIHDIYSVRDLKKNAFSFGTYHVEGYVVKIYTCPPCPKDAMCKPCMPDNIVISDKRKKLKKYSLTDAHMILFVNNAKEFRLGRKYRFLINLSNTRSVDKNFNNTKVIYYEAL